MTELFMRILDMSITASWVILAVMAVRLLLRKAPKKYSYALWAVAVFRLLSPVSIQSVVSAFNLKPFRQAARATGEMQFVPRDITLPPIEIPVADPVATTAPAAITTAPPAVNPAVTNPLPGVTPAVVIDPMQVLITAGMIIWLLGMAVMITVSIINYFRLRKGLRFAIRLEGNIWQCEAVRSPFLVGILRPKIYLPYGLDDQTREYILAHEKYHLKRCDHMAKLLGYAALTIHWFNPLCHLAFRLMNRDMEMSCDEHVLDRNNIPTTQYSYSLLTIATNRRFPAAAPLAFAETGVKERMINVLNWKKPKKWVSVVAVMVCVILLISCATNPKVTTPTVEDPVVDTTTPNDPTESTTAVQANDPVYMQFPGLTWGMTPEEVKSALNISDDMIVEEKNYENEFRVRLSGGAYFGADAESVILRFQQYDNKTALWNVQVTYSVWTDMKVVRDQLIEIYGHGTDYGFTNYEIHNGTVQSYIDWNTLPTETALKSIVFGTSIEDNAENPDPPVKLNHRWAGTAPGIDLFTEQEIERIVALFGSGRGTKADRETALEYLNKHVWTTILCREAYKNRAGVLYRPCVSFTGEHIGFNRQAYQAAAENLAVDELKVGNPAMLEFPGVEWFVTPDELKEALNITEEQILGEDTALDREDTANDYDRYMLTVTDLVLFGRKVTYAYFEFRRDPGYDFEFMNARLMFEENTDMESLKADMTQIYGPGAGESYTYYVYSNDRKQEYTGHSRMDSQLAYYANSSSILRELEGNPFQDVLEDPAYMTHVWVTQNSCSLIPEEVIAYVKALVNQPQNEDETALQDDAMLREMLDQWPWIKIMMSNRCAVTVYRDVMGTEDEWTPYYTYNYVEFDAGWLAEYRHASIE